MSTETLVLDDGSDVCVFAVLSRVEIQHRHGFLSLSKRDARDLAQLLWRTAKGDAEPMQEATHAAYPNNQA